MTNFARVAENASAPYAVAIVHHRSYDDLGRCLASLEDQSLPPAFTVVIDADGEAGAIDGLRRRHPEVHFRSTENLGYAGGANAALAVVAAHAPETAFVLLLNPDVALDPDFARNMGRALQTRPEVALACGRLRRPEAGVLDSAGIEMPVTRRPRDRGADAPDRGQLVHTGPVWGASGAAMWIRRSAADDLAIEGEIFDRDFFLYHEDTDLSWRAHLLGWSVLYVADATAVHGRAWRRERRFEMAPEVRRHSFKNHYLELIKNESGWRLLRDGPVILLWEILRLAHALFRDRAMLSAYGQAARLAGAAFRKRRAIQSRARRRRVDRVRPWARDSTNTS